MNKINSDYLSIGKVAQILELSTYTIARWYKWWESELFKKPDDLFLPKYYYADRRKTKFFKVSDITQLEIFKKKIKSSHRGAMSEFNAAYQWGKRGLRALDNKGMTLKEVQRKIR